MGNIWESFTLLYKFVRVRGQRVMEKKSVSQPNNQKIGTTWRSLHLFYREHRRKTLRSAAGKYGPPLLKREMSNR